VTVTFSSDFGATTSGTIDPTRWDAARKGMGAQYQAFRNQAGQLAGYARQRFVSSAVYKGAVSHAQNVRNTLAMGPINNWALNRAFESAGRELGAGPKSRALARMAGRRSLYNRAFSGPGHQTGMNWVKDMIGMGPSGVAGSGFSRAGGIAKAGILGRALGPAFLAYAGYEGYKKEGVWGAAKGVGGALAETYIMARAISAFGAPALGLAGALGTLSALGKVAHHPAAFLSSGRGWARPWTSEYHKNLKGVQMGGEIVDPHGINATMRQRSLLAIQNSRLNARSGIGNEAALSHYNHSYY
jgi:hypothetical protein